MKMQVRSFGKWLRARRRVIIIGGAKWASALKARKAVDA